MIFSETDRLARCEKAAKNFVCPKIPCECPINDGVIVDYDSREELGSVDMPIHSSTTSSTTTGFPKKISNQQETTSTTPSGGRVLASTSRMASTKKVSDLLDEVTVDTDWHEETSTYSFSADPQLLSERYDHDSNIGFQDEPVKVSLCLLFRKISKNLKLLVRYRLFTMRL